MSFSRKSTITAPPSTGAVYHVAIRKHLEYDQVQFWELIRGRTKAGDEEAKFVVKDHKTPFAQLYVRLTKSVYWNFFLTLTVICNITLFFTYFWWSSERAILTVLVIMTLTCVFYWIDFIGAVFEFRVKPSFTHGRGPRKMIFLLLDAISLLPVSELSLLVVEDHIDKAWKLRSITLLRFYRVPYFFSSIATAERSHWKILMCTYACYVFIFAVAFSNLFLWGIAGYSQIEVADWNESTLKRIIFSLYYVTQILLNVAFGDIRPLTYMQILINSLGMVFGTAMTTGILTGILATSFVNRWKRREQCRFEYYAAVNMLRERKTDKKILDKVLENMMIIWKYRKGYHTSPQLSILPLSLQKEIHFDINFGLLHRSLVFSSQPRAFLRSVTIFMKNISYLPGDIILEAYEMCEAMLCVSSGVIEVLSEENDETVLLSLTTGTIVGEASLFLSIFTKCIVRAATYVEIQMLKKSDFCRLALTYPDIFRSMRMEILGRLSLVSSQAAFSKNFDSDVKELTRRKETKKFLQRLRGISQQTSEKQFNLYRKGLLNLYVLSENIPKVKTLPVNLIKERPWILRPDTHLKRLWDFFIVSMSLFFEVAVPVWAAFYREIQPYMRVFIIVSKIFFVLDIYVQCTTAIEKKDRFTFVTSIKEIISHRLKKVGFYFDILATYHLSIYASLIMPDDTDYATLLLSCNGVLKMWRIVSYVKKREDQVRYNLLFIITAKFCMYFVLIIIWAGVILYLEACPSEICFDNRWLGALEKLETAVKDPTPLSGSPLTTSLYFATVSLFTIGYGDIIPHSVNDCLTLIAIMIFGDMLINLCMAQAASVFKHMERLKTDYQESIFAVDELMREHDIPELYKLRVRNYLRVQWDYDKGYSLKQFSAHEVLPSLQKRIVLIAIMKAFSSVSLFRNCNPDFLKLLAKISRVRVMPPFEDITEAGSLVREMHILENGYCEVWGENEIARKKILGPMNIFGCYEMIAGKPQPLNVRTITHTRVISLSYNGYLRGVTKYPGVKVQIDNLLKTETNVETKHSLKPLVISQNYKTIVEKQKQILSRPFINVFKYHHTITIDYWEPFGNWGKFRFFQFLFMPFSIGPSNLFTKLWMTIRLLSVLTVGIVAPIRFSLLDNQHTSTSYFVILQVFFAIDMYLMFHVAYYNLEGLLIFHPARTATRYLKGNFLIDFISSCPFYLILYGLFDKNDPFILIDAVGFLTVLQFYKFFQVCNYFENDILMKTDKIKILKYVPCVLVVINSITGALLLVQCRETESFVAQEVSARTVLAKELKDYLNVYCFTEGNRTLSAVENFSLYLLTMYWVSESLLGCGYGDINAYNQITMIAAILMIIIGIFFFTFLFASITGSTVTTNVLITQYRRRMLRMIRFLRVKNVSPELQKRLIAHYEYNWHRTEGATPQEIFTFIHLALREKIFSSMYGPTVRRNQAFRGMEKQIISVLGKNLKALYFLRGESIVKYKDIQEYIYVVYKGVVNLLNQQGELIAVMGNGGIFGNVSNNPFSLSEEVVVAAENVDLLQIETKIFYNTLKVFPNTLPLVELLENTKENYILPIREESAEKVQSVFKINLYNTDWAIPSLLRKSDSRLRGRFYINKSVYRIPHARFSDFAILPDSSLSSFLDFIDLLSSTINASMAMYVFCFQDFHITYFIVGYILDIMAYIHIFLKFRKAYYEKSGYCVIDMPMITKRYLYSKKICYDLSASLPLDIFGFASYEGWMFKSVSVLRLNRNILLFNVFKFFKKKQRKLMVNKIYLQAGWILIAIALLIHYLSCLWYMGTCPLGDCFKRNWIIDSNLTKATKRELYVYSSFFVLVTVTSTGYQVIQLCTEIEVVLSIIFMIACRFTVVLLSGVLASSINTQSLNLFSFQEKIEELVVAFNRQNLSTYQMTKLWSYMTLLWHGESGKQMPKFIAQAPYAMRCEVMEEMFGLHLSQSYIFTGLNPAFLRQLSSCFRRYLYFTGNYIVYQGDIDNTMYFIHKGEVSVLTIHPDLLDSVHFVLTTNDNFGMKQGLKQGYAHNFTYRAETTVDLITLTLKEWQFLLKYFPEDAEKIYQRLEDLPPETENKEEEEEA